MITGDWIEVFQEFNELAGDNWKMVLNRMLRGKENSGDLSVVFRRLTIIVKYMLLEENEEELRELQELIHNQILYQLLMQYEEEKVSKLNCYTEKLEMLYLMGEKRKADIMIESIFSNVIVKNNTSYSKEYKKYGFESEEEFRRLACTLDSIVMVAIGKRMGMAGIKEFLSYRFPYDDELVEKVTEQYMKYYEELRERYRTEISEKQNEALEGMKTAM